MADKKPVLEIGKYQEPNSERSKKAIDDYVRGMREKKGGKAISPRNVRKIKLAKGGRAGFKVGGAAKRGVSKILRKK